MVGWLYDDVPYGLLHFIGLIVLLGGAGAIASGRSIAGSWKSFAIVPFYMLLMAAALRFLNYALFGGDLLSVSGFIVAFVILLVASAYGYRARRAHQMATQYSWLYGRAGPVGWSAKPSA